MTKSTIKVAALSAAIVTALAGCNSSSSDNDYTPGISECKTYLPTEPVIVKGDNDQLNRQTISIGATGDMHGRIYAWDYALDAHDRNAGFTKITTLVNKERAKNSNFLLIELGDTVQGNSAELFNSEPVHPVVESMNFMEYDVWVPGNHEFDFERAFLERSIEGFNGAVISSNIIWDTKSAGCNSNGQEIPFLRGYQIFDYNSAKVAVIGLTPSNVPVWNASNPDNFKNLDFKDEFTSLEETVDQVIAHYQPDVVIGALHHGRNESHTRGVNEIATKMANKFDVIFMGHEHAEFIEQAYIDGDFTEGMQDISVEGENQEENKDLSGVYNAETRHEKVKVIEPGKWGWGLATAEIELEKDHNGQWQITDTTLFNRKVDVIEEDVDLQDEMEWVHEKSRRVANEKIGEVQGNFTYSTRGGADEAVSEERHYDGQDLRLYTTIHNAKLADMPLTNLINQIQIMNVEKYADVEVDVSAAALFSDGSNLFNGDDYLKKDSSNLYMYDNRVVAVHMTGKNLKEYMESSYAYFNQYQKGDITVSFNPEIASFYYDIFGGKISFAVDLSEPKGNRIQDLLIDGMPLDESKKYVVAVNDYRLGDPLLNNGWVEQSDVIWDSVDVGTYAIRDMLTEYVAENYTLASKDFESSNWYIKQYGQPNEQGVISRKGEMLETRAGEGKELWQKLKNQQICVVRDQSRSKSISVAVNVNDDSTWFENDNFDENATQEELHEGCNFRNQP